MASKAKTKAGKLESEIDGLYALPLDEFTAAREELARRLRGDGDREAAGEVKALRKPSLAAWALNHVRHNEPARVKDLLTAGNKLQRAQAQLVSGGKPDQLREAAAAERQMVDDVVALAEKALADAGHPVAPALQAKLRATAHAAAVSPEAGELLDVGRLITDHEVSDLGLMGGGAALVSREREPAKRRGPAEREAAKREEGKREAAEREAAEREAAEREAAEHEAAKREAAERKALERKARGVERELDRARAQHAKLADQLNLAAQRVNELEATLQELRR
jgi:hypothetical protein